MWFKGEVAFKRDLEVLHAWTWRQTGVVDCEAQVGSFGANNSRSDLSLLSWSTFACVQL